MKKRKEVFYVGLPEMQNESTWGDNFFQNLHILSPPSHVMLYKEGPIYSLSS